MSEILQKILGKKHKDPEDPADKLEELLNDPNLLAELERLKSAAKERREIAKAFIRKKAPGPLRPSYSSYLEEIEKAPWRTGFSVNPTPLMAEGPIERRGVMPMLTEELKVKKDPQWIFALEVPKLWDHLRKTIILENLTKPEVRIGDFIYRAYDVGVSHRNFIIRWRAEEK